MELQAILEQIISDAKATAAKTLREAGEKAEGIKSATSSRIEGLMAQTRQQALADGDEAEKRMRRMAELEEKKLLLSDKRKLIEQVFSHALQSLQTLDDLQKTDIFLGFMLEQAAGNETVLPGMQSQQLINDGFIQAANAALVQKGRKGCLALGKQTVNGTGFVLQKEGALIDCTFESLLKGMQSQQEAEVASILFT